MAQCFDAVIFDLDGTLLDTLEAIADAGNHAMGTLGLPRRPVKDFRFLAGQGLPHLIHGLLGAEHASLFDRAVAAHRDRYQAQGDVLTRPFEGMEAMLSALQREGVKLAVLSNKPHDLTVEAVRRHLGAFQFDVVLGHRDGHLPKPDPAGAREILGQLGVSAERVVYVGDTDVDMQTGKGAGCFTVGVLWGFRERDELTTHGADALIATPGELVPLVLRSSED